MNIASVTLRKQRERIYRTSGSNDSHTLPEMVAGDSSKGLPPKKKRNRFHVSLWGTPQSRAGRMRFKRYLAGIKSADRFLKDERSIIFFKNMAPKTRKQVYRRLREVDPIGYKKIMGRLIAHGQGLRRAQQVAMSMVVKEDTVAVERVVECAASPRLLKLMPLGGLKNVLALCVAAGHSRDEVAAMVAMEPSEFNAMVTDKDVREAAQEMPKAIVHLANGIVLRDLLKGEINNQTEAADKIAARRSKLAVDISKESRERSKFSEELEKKREDDMTKRFGVDRKKGEAVNADSQS